MSYALDGEDKASFELIVNQLQVRAGTMLNYETKDTYTVVVMAKDGSGQTNDTASITVTIMVVDLDEEPEISEAGLMVSGRKAISYNENATVAVETYSALGPDAASATWSLQGDDVVDFSISRTGGELGFENPPNYEMPSDEGANGVYRITVVANDGTNTAMMDVAVTVANVDEPGVITLNPANPGVGSVISATLEDPDGGTSDVAWGWQRSLDREIGWNSIPGATSDTYTLVAADGGHYLRAVATYTDLEGTDKRAEQATTGAARMRPTFSGETDTRTVPENSAMGTAVGAPVSATAADNYRLGGADAASFAIGSTTGQIMTKAALDFETKASYTVTVTASDTAGASDEITVTITVENVEEMGEVTFSAQPVVGIEVTASVTDPDVADQDTVMWQWARSDAMDGTFDPIGGATSSSYTPVEVDGGMYLRVTVTYTDGEGSGKMAIETSATPVNTAPMFATETAERMVPENTAADENVGAPATAMDADTGDTLTYSLGGTDMASFIVDNMGQIMVGAGTMLDYETKASYMVTVTASDGIASDSIDVTIMVTNVDETGEVTLSTMQPVVGTEITATLTDPDDRITGTTWQWAKASARNGSYSNIEDAASMSYTPVDGDIGSYLRATAMYTDGEGSDKSAMGDSDNMVTALVISGMSSGEYAENGTMPVATYMAAGPEAEMASWTLEGDDAGLFSILGGVLSFNNPPDYENPADVDTDNTYTVTVKAYDGTYMDTHDVMVMVTNEDELGMLVGRDSVGYMENDTVAVGTYTADGPVAASWSLEGDDMGAFSIDGSSGELMFASPPDFEAPADMGMDNMYQVTVKAEAGGEMNMIDVTLTVTNADEDGTVTLSTTSPVVGTELTAMLTDPDAGVTGEVWQWARSMDTTTWDDIADAKVASYTPVEEDDGYYLQASASYTDGHGSGKTAEKVSANAVEGGLAISGMSSVDYAENGMDAVATYTAAGPNADMATWTLAGDDAGDFMISGGMLTFVSAPDYEMPADADTDNTYMVTVKAADGTYSNTHAVTVMVTNEDEPGRVTFWRDGADVTDAAIMVGDMLDGAVDDSDGNQGDTFPIAMYTRIANVTSWQWAKSKTPDMMDSWMDIGTGGMYTVMEDDDGYYLRATASYTDGEGSGKTKMAMSAYAVDAEGTGDPLLAKYDKSGNGKIDLDEALGAVAIYFEISRSDALPEAKDAAEVEVLDVVARYFSDRLGAS